jgi:hypothetical protein
MRLRLCCVAALLSCAACERAGFESLGTLAVAAAGTRNAALDAGAPAQPTIADAAPPMTSSAPDPPAPTTLTNAGQPAADGGRGQAGSAGRGSGGSGGSANAPSGLHGDPNSMQFDGVASAYVAGLSDEYGTTTVYLLDDSVTCTQLSSFAWLASLPSNVLVLEVSFPSTAKLGNVVSDSVVSVAHGGMYSFNKVPAVSNTLVLSRNVMGGIVEGTLQAMFPSGSVTGSFHADFCASGLSF